MTYAEQIQKLAQDIRAIDGGYTKEELQTIYRSAKAVMLFAACELADFEED